MAYIQFLGAAGTVTGSKHLINTGDLQVLVDCGLFQGKKEWRERNWQDMPIPAREIDAVILTHAHLDHCGWIPRLHKEGYRGKVYATPATIDLCGVILPDSGHLQEEDADFHNRQKSSKHNPALPLYTLEEAQDCLKNFIPVAFHTPTQLSPKFSFQFVHAAHILGSGMVEVSVDVNGATKQLVFTGDIGRVRESNGVAPGKVVRTGPETVDGQPTNVLVMESTYGNREHPKTDARPELARIIRETVNRGGTVVIPAFAVERTQKLLFMLKQLMEDGQIPKVPVHIDSPMAIKAIEIFIKHTEEYSDETKALIAKYGSPLKWDNFNFDTTSEQSKKVNSMVYPMIIVSSSGMVTGGRVLHHLIHRLSNPKNTVLFIGFQAPGTRGATIKSGAPTVKIFNLEVPIRAQVASIEQFSDHADTPELLQWLHTFERAPQVTYLVHGEPSASTLLKAAIEKEMKWNVAIAEWMQKVEVD
ncbi:MAG: beta-lactamase-like protein [Candidatus Angelobacter sp.]|nr:beta-lactamase-like protein [Candidatus Angelobacter sp.]